MKKICILIATFIITLFVGIITINNNVAFSSTKLNTESFLPASFIEFYDLNSPEDIYYKDGYLIIAEYVEGQNNTNKSRLVIYDPTTKTYVTNDTINYSISNIAMFDEFVLILMNSRIYYLNLSSLSQTPIDTQVFCTSFSVNGTTLITTLSSTINSYTLGNDNGNLTISNHSEIKDAFEPSNVMLSSNGYIYYTVNSKELRLIDTTFTERTVTTLDKTIVNLTEYGDYIYFTASDGIYKILKNTPNTITKIFDVSNQTTLGYVVDPTGITVTDNSILVADKKLNCVQEISPTTDKFTTFAITTESTCDYRLTASAENLVLSENYIYALDNTFENKKRIVKTSIDNTQKIYKKIDLTAFYNNYEGFEVISFTASDDMLLINYKSTTQTETKYYLGLYKQIDGQVITLKKVYEIENSSVSSLFYLSKEFYYTDKYNAFDAKDYININKITYTTTENDTPTIKTTKVTKNTEIEGVLIDATIDVFGNYYLIYSLNNTSYLIRYYNGTKTLPVAIDYNVLNTKTDFNGNVYVLDDNNRIHKYVYDFTNKTFDETAYEINVRINGLTCKDFELNYQNDCFYALSEACILKSSDNTLQIEHLKSISANDVELKSITTDLKFIQVNQTAKMFKVSVDDFIVDGNNKYFKNIEAISNPNTTKIYLVISELENYYLISYSPSFYALVRKSSVEADATLITNENYAKNNITIKDNNGEIKYITNDTATYSRAIVDEKIEVGTACKNNKVYLLKTITFNNKTIALISNNENLTPTGYILQGYLKDEIENPNTLISQEIIVIKDNSSRKVSNVLSILAIALAVTVAMLILEKKLLFNDKL